MTERGREFVKAEAAGNDLVLVDARKRPLRDPAAAARAWCDRHFGVGGDGLMVLETCPDAEARARMFNPDGTEDFCGNGLRCVVAFLRPDGGETTIVSPRGRHGAQVRVTAPRHYEVAVDLVTPSFDPAEIPARLEGLDPLNYRLETDGRSWTAASLSVGTTHTVIFLDQPLPDRDFRRYSPRLETHPFFPRRTTVLWCQRRSSDIVDVRVWERGVGETLACGSGACAVAVVGRCRGLLGDRVTVRTAGGVMVAEWSGRGPVRLTGPARLLYRGVLTQDVPGEQTGSGAEAREKR
jgi:diaminopimelate epimerase